VAFGVGVASGVASGRSGKSGAGSAS